MLGRENQAKIGVSRNRKYFICIPCGRHFETWDLAAAHLRCPIHDLTSREADLTIQAGVQAGNEEEKELLGRYACKSGACNL